MRKVTWRCNVAAVKTINLHTRVIIRLQSPHKNQNFRILHRTKWLFFCQLCKKFEATWISSSIDSEFQISLHLVSDGHTNVLIGRSQGFP